MRTLPDGVFCSSCAQTMFRATGSPTSQQRVIVLVTDGHASLNKQIRACQQLAS
jgi:hypothetical protein